MEEHKGSDPPCYPPHLLHDQREDDPPGGGAKSPAGGDIPTFSLYAALVGHTEDVRSLASSECYLYSGARDKTVKAWALTKEGWCGGGLYSSPAADVTLPDWVNALAVRPADQVNLTPCAKRGKSDPLGSSSAGEAVAGIEEGDGDVVVAGCRDGAIYVMSWGGEVASLIVRRTLQGHDAPISSLAWGPGGLLLSGSWDETARGWDLGSGTCEWVLRGHENNVCVLGLGANSVATGSTGLEVEGHLVGQQIRLWKGTPLKECKSLTDHKSGIRDLCGVSLSPATSPPSPSSPRFCSASNDGTVRTWTVDGECCGVFTIPGESFVFSARPLGSRLVATGDDSGNLSVFRLPEKVSTHLPRKNATVIFKHPKTVWAVAALPGGDGAAAPRANDSSVADVATGSADHVIRVFTSDARRALREEDLQELEEALRQVTRGDGDPSSSDQDGCRSKGADRFPPLSEMHLMVGREDGQLSAFADDATGEAKVYRWNGGGREGSPRWEMMGTLRESVRKIAFEGGLYDQVIPVEVESASRGFLTFELGVNYDDEPSEVATAFCKRHSLGPEYVPQVEQFVAMVGLLRKAT